MSPRVQVSYAPVRHLYVAGEDVDRVRCCGVGVRRARAAPRAVRAAEPVAGEAEAGGHAAAAAARLRTDDVVVPRHRVGRRAQAAARRAERRRTVTCAARRGPSTETNDAERCLLIYCFCMQLKRITTYVTDETLLPGWWFHQQAFVILILNY